MHKNIIMSAKVFYFDNKQYFLMVLSDFTSGLMWITCSSQLL